MSNEAGASAPYVYKSKYQPLRQLQFNANAQRWQDDKRYAELARLLADFVATAREIQDGECGRCLSPLDAANIEEDNESATLFVHRKCPTRRKSWFKFWRRWSPNSRYLRHYGLR